MRDHDDLLVGDYEDSYYNPSLKMFHTFQWASRFCRPYNPTFVFLDDDYAVNVNNSMLQNNLYRPAPHNTNFISSPQLLLLLLLHSHIPPHVILPLYLSSTLLSSPFLFSHTFSFLSSASLRLSTLTFATFTLS
ncbi:unnamed protein product [Hydatigera taeniaeformis]|uniref:Hexosyltransferase n=1 Tax=Hydatigena taeniaeformis TaxID=6205 RepID=A0A0R3XAY4_HYDTA|nr:unnamed protein product [Hydatigera taeniaeformis]